MAWTYQWWMIDEKTGRHRIAETSEQLKAPSDARFYIECFPVRGTVTMDSVLSNVIQAQKGDVLVVSTEPVFTDEGYNAVAPVIAARVDD